MQNGAMDSVGSAGLRKRHGDLGRENDSVTPGVRHCQRMVQPRFPHNLYLPKLKPKFV